MQIERSNAATASPLMVIRSPFHMKWRKRRPSSISSLRTTVEMRRLSSRSHCVHRIKVPDLPLQALEGS